MRKNRNFGFTLIELTIVLVIIGILISGILVAQSMVETAKLNSIIKKLQQYDIAVSNFITTYNSLPGDSSIMSTAGNGDGSITNTGGTFGNWNGEIANFWPHLQETNMIKDEHTLVSTNFGNCCGGCPQSNGSGIYNTPLFLNHSLDKNCIVPFTLGGVHYWATAGSNSNLSPGGTSYGTGFPVKYIRMLDIKLDDGIPITGILVTYDSSTNITNVSSAGGGAYWDEYCSAGSSCNLQATESNGKSFRIEMLSQVGQNQ